MTKVFKTFSLIVISLFVLSAFGWMSHHITKGDKKFGFLTEPVKFMYTFLDNFAKSVLGGAKAYIPKEKMGEIDTFLSDLLKAQEGTEKPYKWFFYLKSFFNDLFGEGWQQSDPELKKLRDELERKYKPINWDD